MAILCACRHSFCLACIVCDIKYLLTYCLLEADLEGNALTIFISSTSGQRNIPSNENFQFQNLQKLKKYSHRSCWIADTVYYIGPICAWLIFRSNSFLAVLWPLGICRRESE